MTTSTIGNARRRGIMMVLAFGLTLGALATAMPAQAYDHHDERWHREHDRWDHRYYRQPGYVYGPPPPVVYAPPPYSPGINLIIPLHIH